VEARGHPAQAEAAEAAQGKQEAANGREHPDQDALQQVRSIIA
jgi:hypothetical protein